MINVIKIKNSNPTMRGTGLLQTTNSWNLMKTYQETFIAIC